LPKTKTFKYYQWRKNVPKEGEISEYFKIGPIPERAETTVKDGDLGKEIGAKR